MNVNQGEKIYIRLRPHDHEDAFLPYESLLGTMLHELVHNRFGPHDKKFYRELDEITEECEKMMAKGTSDKVDGFYGDGIRLGGFKTINAEDAAHAAGLRALERAKTAHLAAPPQKLGGKKLDHRNFSPKEMAAIAAERRYQDNIWCGVSLEEQKQIEAEIQRQIKARNAGVQGHLHEEHEMRLNNPRGEEEKDKGKGIIKEEPLKPKNQASLKRYFEPVDLEEEQAELESLKKRQKTEDPGFIPTEEILGYIEWDCKICTFLNSPQWLQCNACGSVRQ